MKIQDIVFKEKCIVLGVFHTKTFSYFDENTPAMAFWKFSDIVPRDEKYKGLMRCIMGACGWTDQIIFVLDDVHFPINIEYSTTCRELEAVCKDEEIFNKCIFVKGDNIIEFDKNLVLTS